MNSKIRPWTAGALGLLVAASSLSGAAMAAEEAAASATIQYPAASELHAQLIGRYTSGAELDEGGAEIVVYDAASQRGYSVNGAEESLDIFDMSVLKRASSITELPLLKRISLETLTAGKVTASDITSVALHPESGVLAISVPNDPKTEPGHVVFVDTEGQLLSFVTVGSLPDMVTFTPDGKYALVANEGEPNDDYSVDPEGSVSVIDLSGDVENLTNEQVRTAKLTDDVISTDVRKAKEDVPYAQDLEPEYVASNADSKTAIVSMQEANALGVLDIEKASFISVRSLGYKDYSAAGNEFDGSDKDDATELKQWPVLGMYMPDGMDVFSANGKLYVLTANEGDSREYDGYEEEARVEDLVDQYALNADLFEGYTQKELDALVEGGLFEETQLGRLKSTIAAPKNADGKYEAVYGFGARSYTIWEADAEGNVTRVYDSGSRFEEITLAAAAEASLDNMFNADNTENGADDRSDDKGPEPEAATHGEVNGKRYAFVGLERTGGIYWQDITDPTKPGQDGYFSSRDFSAETAMGDLAPEGLAFVSAEESPNGMPLLIVAHEVSGTVAVYSLGSAPKEEVPAASETPAPAAPATPATPATPSVEKKVYIVKSGDNLSKIAAKYGLTWQDLQAVNQFKNPNLIFPGQTVIIP